MFFIVAYGAVTLPPLTAVRIGVPGGSKITIRNLDGNTIWLGIDASVTDSNGFPLFSGESTTTLASVGTSPLGLWAYSVPGTIAGGARWLAGRGSDAPDGW